MSKSILNKHANNQYNTEIRDWCQAYLGRNRDLAIAFYKDRTESSAQAAMSVIKNGSHKLSDNDYTIIKKLMAEIEQEEKRNPKKIYTRKEIDLNSYYYKNQEAVKKAQRDRYMANHKKYAERYQKLKQTNPERIKQYNDKAQSKKKSSETGIKRIKRTAESKLFYSNLKSYLKSNPKIRKLLSVIYDLNFGNKEQYNRLNNVLYTESAADTAIERINVSIKHAQKMISNGWLSDKK